MDKKNKSTVVDDLTCIMDEQEKAAAKLWADAVPLHGGHSQNKDELDDLIVEREWFDQRFPQRVAALTRHHREQHGKDPQRVFLPTKFVDWIHKRWGTNLKFEVPSERIATLADSMDRAVAVIEIVNLEVVRAIRLEAAHDTIGLDTVLRSEEASIRCGHCRGEFPLLVAERWTQVQCPRCGKTLLVEWNSATGELIIHPTERTDKP